MPVVFSDRSDQWCVAHAYYSNVSLAGRHAKVDSSARMHSAGLIGAQSDTRRCSISTDSRLGSHNPVGDGYPGENCREEVKVMTKCEDMRNIA